MNKCIFYILCIHILYISQVFAQDVQITDMSGGLNTNTSVLKLKPNEGNYCLNLNIDRGYLEKRKGYLALLPEAAWPSGDTLAGDDPTIGLFSFRRSDGQRRIVGIIADSNNTSDLDGLGWLAASPSYDQIPPGSGAYYYFKEGALWRYYKYVYQGVTPFWTYWNDRCYMSNGRQRPLVFYPYRFEGSDGYARELVPLTPGEPLIVPMEGSGNLNGEYYYMIGHSGACGAAIGDQDALNGSFETWEADTLDLWDTLSYTTGNIFDETDSVFHGTHSLKIVSDKGVGSVSYHAVTIGQWLVLDADSIYRVSARVNKLTDYGNIDISARDSVGNIINSIKINDETNGFTAVSFEFKPVSDSTRILIYSFGACDECDTSYIDSLNVKTSNGNRAAVVTKPVIAKSENVMLTHFPWQTIVNGCAYADAAYDSLTIYIYRTKANPGELDYDDDFYKIASIALTDTSQIDTLHYIDTIPDDTLGYSGFNTIINMDSALIGRSAADVLTGVRVGAPTYVSNDSADAAYDGYNIFATPIANATDVYKTSYICTYYDSLINAESDSSRSLHIFKHANDLMYHIGLPPLPGGMAYLKRRLYKSYSYITTVPKDSVTGIKDTTISIFYIDKVGDFAAAQVFQNTRSQIDYITSFIDNGSAIAVEPPVGYRDEYLDKTISHYLKYYQYANSVDSTDDTTTTFYRMIGEIDGSDSVFVDTITFDSTNKGKPYFKSAAPFNLNGITSFQDRVWGYHESTVEYSYLDSGGFFGSFHSITLDPDDGDFITAIIPMRDYIKVYKNRKQYAVYSGSEFEYERRELVDGLGCIAPHTALPYMNGVFYLSEKGLVNETGSVYRDKGSNFGVISEPINNILMNRTRQALQKAIGFIHNDKYMLSFPDIDTTFVYFIKSGGWSIYNYAFAQACLYDTLTTNDNNGTPSGDMVFINGEDDQLYKADTTSTDNGTVIRTHWRSAPFPVSADNYTISKIGVWRESNDATGGLDARFYNMEGDSIGYKYIDSIARRYDVIGFNKGESHYFQIDVRDTTLDSLAIDKIDIWLTPLQESQKK